MVMKNDELKNDEQAILLLWHRLACQLLQAHQGVWLTRRGIKSVAQAWADLGLHANHVARHQDASNSEDAFLAQIDADVQANNYHLLFAR